MKFRHLVFAAFVPLAACSTSPADPFAATTPSPGSSSTAAADKTFLQQSAQSDMFEVASSQLAMVKSRNRAVRRFAQTMIDDHTSTSRDTEALAGRKGVALPNNLDPAVRQKMTVLQGAGQRFDSEYLAAQTAGHREALQTIDAELSGGVDPDIKGAAQVVRPIIQAHLDMLQQMGRR